MKTISATIVVAFIATGFLASSALANIGDSYGFGSRSTALGGNSVAWGFNGYAAASNPAGLPLTGDKRMVFSYGGLLMSPRFFPINDVVVENTYTSDKTTVGNVNNDYRATFGQTIGFAYKLFPESFDFTLGLTTFIPIEQSAYMDTGESFVPEYFLYRSRTNRPQFELGVGMSLGQGFSLGVGFHLGFALTSNATVFLQTDATKPSTMRFASSLKPKAAPYIGLLFAPVDNPEAFSIGAVFRMPVKSANNMVLKTGARAFGSFAALDFNFTALSALYYDPTALQLGLSAGLGGGNRVYLQADWQGWGKFEAPALSLVDPKNESCNDEGSCGVNISAGNNPSFKYRDIIVPRIGWEIGFGGTTLRAGYAYQQSILVGDIPAEIGNYLDPPKHMFNGGIGFEFSRFLGFNTPSILDVHFSWHRLKTQQITKTPGNELGELADDKIGAPGYNAGGKIIGGGVSLTLPF